MQRPSCLPIHGLRVSELTVDKYYQDFNDPAWSTFTLLTLGLDFEHPGPDEEIVRLFCIWVCNRRVFLPGTIYANPCGIVASPHGDQCFIEKARQLQSEWLIQFNAGLHSARRVKKEMEKVSPVIRQLAFTGVLFIDNRHIFPHQWPDKVGVTHLPSSQKRILPGENFGSLVVIEHLPQGKLRCQCACGNVVVKYRRHLLSGRTKSCGCLQEQLHERLRNRRQDRGWKYTGEIRS